MVSEGCAIASALVAFSILLNALWVIETLVAVMVLNLFAMLFAR
jgi:hypothetical protein